MQNRPSKKYNQVISLSQHDLEKALSAKNFIEVRNIYGGPAPDETKAALCEQQLQHKEDAQWREDIELFVKKAAEDLSSQVKNAEKKM